MNIHILNFIIIFLIFINIIVERNENNSMRKALLFYILTLVLANIFNILNHQFGNGLLVYVVIKHLIYGLISSIFFYISLINFELKFDNKRKWILTTYTVLYFITVFLMTLFGGWSTYDPTFSNNILNPVIFVTLFPIIHIFVLLLINKKYQNLLPTIVYLILSIACCTVAFIRFDNYVYLISFTLLLLFVESSNNVNDIAMDKLTNVYNRGTLDKFVSRNKIRLDSGVVFLIDLDHFKHINDYYGHKAGDIILKDFSKILTNSVSKKYKVFRYGGDEFVIISTESKEKEIFLKRLKNNIEAYNLTKPIPISYSCGFYEISEGVSLHEAIEFADKKMYKTKLRHKLKEKQKTDKININKKPK